MKPALDKEELSDYRPMSNLSLISKIIDRVVESRLMDHLTSNSLLNSHQSANIILPKPLFCTSTITSFRTGSQKVSCLCLLDLSGVFWQHWPWHLDQPFLILVWYSWLCSQLVQVISVVSLLPCQMWNRPVFLVLILLRCPPRLCPWSTTLRHVHHSSQYPHFLLFPKPPPLRSWHSALSFLPSDSLRLQHRSPLQWSR